MLEIEVKLAIGSSAPEIRLLEKIGAVLRHARCLEDNVLLDVREGRLLGRGAMLRIRKYGEMSTLAFKEPSDGPVGYKVRREIETAVSSADLLQEVLEAAGFRRIWRYMKYRTVFAHGSMNVFVDETPIGNYLELEGPPGEIDALAVLLGRTPSQYIAASYRQIYEEHCRRIGVAPGDLVFAEGPAS